MDDRKLIVPGKGHHFIPQKILRNFSFLCDETHFCYKYTHDNEPRKDSVRNIAKKDKFYWDGKDKSADIHITNQAEKKANDIIDNLINSANKYSLKDLLSNSSWLINFMSHRTRSRRDRLSFEKSLYLHELIKIMEPDKISVDAILSESMDIRAKLISQGKIPEEEAEFKEYCSSIWETAKDFDDILLQGMIADIREELQNISSEVKKSQLDILRQISTIDFSFELFNNNYALLRCDPNSFILGDSAVVYSTLSGYRGTLVKASPPVIWAALPISHNIALVATKDPRYPPSIDEINFASAQVSQHFFVAPILSHKFIDLCKNIGSSPYVFSEEETFELIQRAREFFVQPVRGIFKPSSI